MSDSSRAARGGRLRLAGEGLLLLDKEDGPTSRALVDRVVARFGRHDIGHAGTLDPFATGLMLVLIGRATRLVPWIQEWPKTYDAVVRFGLATDTLDRTGVTTATAPVPDDLAGRLQAAVASLTGDIRQAPPMVSAVRVGGRRLHELARAGEVVDRDARSRTVHAFTIRQIRLPDVEMAVTCSSGTYIRVLAESLGQSLGVPAHLTALRRTAIGPYAVDTAMTTTELAGLEPDDLERRLVPPASVLSDWPSRTATSGEVLDIGHGRIPAGWGVDADPVGGHRFRVQDAGGSLLALVERHGEGHRFLRVFPGTLP